MSEREFIAKEWRDENGILHRREVGQELVRCKECKWLRYCETEDLDLYLDCDKTDGGGIPRNEDWFCADGEREGER